MKRLLCIGLLCTTLQAETKTVVRVDTAAIVDSLIRLWLQRHERIKLCDPLFDSGCTPVQQPSQPPANQTGQKLLPGQCPGIAPCEVKK